MSLRNQHANSKRELNVYAIRNFILSVGGILACLVCISVGYNDFKGWLFMKAEYRKAQGVVVASYVYGHTAGGALMESYFYRIRYKYIVAGKKYTSDVVTFDSTKADKTGALANTMIEKYPVDKKITVYYLARDPQFAVLEPGVPLLTKVYACVAFFFLLTLIGCAIWSYRLI